MEEEKQLYTIILRHDTSTQWMVNDPILSLSEYGVEDDTHKVKRGNGESKWSELPYEDFGLQYIVTFENLNGNIKDNKALSEALNSKISSSVFADINNTVIAGIQLTNGENGTLARLLKTTKDVVSGTTQMSTMYIKSTDNSIQGLWSVDETGAQVLNLSAECTIVDYEKDHTYYKDQICYHKNKLYRAIDKFIATSDFNPDQWVLLASLHSNDILYDNLISGLDATTVKAAIDELKRRNDTKVTKSTETSIVYGTSKTGEQTVIPIDDLRKVDTVNHIAADLNKNIQIDANQINYSDANPELGTVRAILDGKVDKTVAGVGAKIVRDVQINYNEETGTIELTEDKVSLENGTSTKEVQTVNAVSETELTKVKNDLLETIDTTKEDLIQKIDTDIASVNSKIDNEISTVKDLLTDAVDTINETINDEVSALEETIANNKKDIETKLTEGLDTKIDKDIADNLVTDITVIDGEEPTIQITRKNTGSKEAIVNNIHFKANGKIVTRFESADHIIIDSTKIDEAINTNTKHLETIDSQILSIEKEISALQEHDVNHEAILATHTQQISSLETKVIEHTTHLANIDISITDIKNTNANQETHLTTIDNTLTAHTEQLQDTADSIVEMNRNISTNASNIKNLQDTVVVYNDERNIDVENNIALRKNMMLTGATPTQYYNLASMRTYNEGLEDEAIQTEYGTIHVHMNLNSKDRPTIELPSSEKHEISYKDELDALQSSVTENIDTINSNLQELNTNKLDKAFTPTLVNTLSYTAPNGTDLITFNKVDINPSDNQTTSSEFKIKSTDNTLIAKPIMEDEKLVGIDLATNLDIDVHYFITSEILNTTIGAENTIQISSLTDTTSDNIEVKDIVSDVEGTWARVQEVDVEAGTFKCVTFAKHAQAVWGTIKGNIDDQLDLKEKLDKKLTKDIDRGFIMTSITASNGNAIPNGNVKNISLSYRMYNIADDSSASYRILDMSSTPSIQIRRGSGTNPVTYYADVKAEEVDFDPLDTGLTNNKLSPVIREIKGLVDTNTSNITGLTNTKLDKVTTPDILYGTNSSGEQIQIEVNTFGKVDKVNNVEPVDKNVTLTADNIELSEAIGETPQTATIQTVLSNMATMLSNMQKDLANQIREYQTATEYTKTGTYTVQNYVTFTRDDGVMLMAKVNNNFTSSFAEATAYENFALDVTNGNLVLVGIPEQSGEGSTETIAKETMNILNQVDGEAESYDGLGGTEEEISGIMDDILGNK